MRVLLAFQGEMGQTYLSNAEEFIRGWQEVNPSDELVVELYSDNLNHPDMRELLAEWGFRYLEIPTTDSAEPRYRELWQLFSDWGRELANLDTGSHTYVISPALVTPGKTPQTRYYPSLPALPSAALAIAPVAFIYGALDIPPLNVPETNLELHQIVRGIIHSEQWKQQIQTVIDRVGHLDLKLVTVSNLSLAGGDSLIAEVAKYDPELVALCSELWQSLLAGAANHNSRKTLPVAPSLSVLGSMRAKSVGTQIGGANGWGIVQFLAAAGCPVWPLNSLLCDQLNKTVDKRGKPDLIVTYQPSLRSWTYLNSSLEALSDYADSLGIPLVVWANEQHCSRRDAIDMKLAGIYELDGTPAMFRTAGKRCASTWSLSRTVD